MLTLLFLILLLSFCGEMIGLAIRATWGFAKIILCVIFFPVVIIIMAMMGLVYIAVPVLAIVGVISLIKNLR